MRRMGKSTLARRCDSHHMNSESHHLYLYNFSFSMMKGKLMVLMRTRDGHLELLEFRVGETLHDNDAPLTFTMIVPEYQGKTLILYHSERNQWEIPGGGIEPGESPEDGATRELREETGQIAASFAYKGLFKIRFVHENRMEYGMLYTARLDSLQPFTANPEADRILLWDRLSELEGRLSELSQALLTFC